MARGWESKSVEMQIEERESSRAGGENTPADADRRRALELLELSRKRLCYEIETASNARVRELKLRALSHIEAAIAAHAVSRPAAGH